MSLNTNTVGFKLSFSDLAKWLILGGLLAYIYYPTFLWMIDRWSARDSYFAHGFIIPFVSLFWIYQKRNVLALVEKKSEVVGLLILLFAAAVQIFSSLFRVYFISAFSFVFLILGAT